MDFQNDIVQYIFSKLCIVERHRRSRGDII